MHYLRWDMRMRYNEEFQTAIGHYEKALEINEYKQQEVNALLGLGHAYRLNKEFQTAIGHYEKALEITKEHEYKQQEIDALIGLGDAYIEKTTSFKRQLDTMRKLWKLQRSMNINNRK